MQPPGQQPVSRPVQPPTVEADALRAPASAVEAIMGRLGLARAQDEPATDEETLSAHLADPSWAVRVGAVQKLGKMGRQAPLGLLLAAMRDTERGVRVAAARALSRNPRPAAISALVAALEDSEWPVRAEAVLALGEMRDLAPLEPLLAALQDKDAAVRAAAAQALGTRDDPRAWRSLQVALRDEDWSVREAAALALVQLDLEESPTIISLASPPPDTDADPLIHGATEAGLLQIYPPPLSLPLPVTTQPSPWPQPRVLAESCSHEYSTASALPQRKKAGSPSSKLQVPERAPVSASLSWPRRAMHTAGGVLAAALITGLFLAWLAIETQPRSTQGQSGANTTHAITFTTYHQHSSDVQNVAWSPDGQLLASADIRGTISIWQASSGKTLVLSSQHNTVLALAWSSPTTLMVACAEATKALQVLTLTPGLQPASQILQTGLPGVPSVAAWSPDHQMLAFDNGAGSLQIWNMLSGIPITTIFQKHVSYTRLVWSADSTQLATISTTGVLQIWDTSTGLPISSLPGSYLATLVAWISCGRYQSGTLLIDSGNTLLKWSYGAKGEKITSFLTESAYNFANINGLFISTFAISPNGKQLLLATSDGLIQARDMLNGNLIYLYTGHTAQVNTIQWSPDKRHIASAGMDTTVQVWQET